MSDYTAATGHSYGNWSVTKAATCTTKGSERRDCNNCNHYETRDIAQKQHAWNTGVVTKEPTETSTGEKVFTCVSCGQTRTERIPELSHTHNYVAVVTDPTCRAEGYTTYTCTCGSYVDDYVSALGHHYITRVTVPSCTEQGYTTHTCARCNDSYVADYTSPAGHSWDTGVVTKEPTEATTGEKVFTCGSCGQTRSEVIPELTHTHNYTETVTQPTCTEQGFTTHTCACGDAYEDSFVSATGHQYGADHICTGCNQKDPSATDSAPTDPTEPTSSVPTSPNSQPGTESSQPSVHEQQNNGGNFTILIAVLATIGGIGIGTSVVLIILRKK